MPIILNVWISKYLDLRETIVEICSKK